MEKQKTNGKKKPRVYTVKITKEHYERMLIVRMREGKTMAFQVADALRQYWSE